MRKMTCAQLRTKTRTSISRKICYVKSGFQILYAVEQFSSLFSKDKLKANSSNCVGWSRRVKKSFEIASAVESFWDTGLSRPLSDGFAMLMSPNKGETAAMVAPARVIWLCACVRYWLGCGLVYVCPAFYDCTNFKVIFAYAVELSSIYFS